MPASKKEHHHSGRIGWMRAAVLGANDGILTTSSLVLGVAAAHATHRNLLIAGMAGSVAGAMSMAAGEYVSVHSQADTEHADLDIERAEIKTDNLGEHEELAAIYVARGLDPSLAKQVAQQLMARDALGAHASDELGISETVRPRPIQAALSSAGSFAIGALMPLLPQPILAGFLAFENGWKSDPRDFLAKALSRDQGDGRIDIGCIAAYGTFGCEGADCQTSSQHDKAVTSFLLDLITKLQRIGTAPAIDMAAYSRWLQRDPG
jgi:VIT1/CCC1 family predicted Fe2+/Mn2+ transporter